MSRFYRAPTKRLIARAGSGRFRTTTLADIGMATCGKCHRVFTPDYASLGSCPDPRAMRDLRETCPECTANKPDEGRTASVRTSQSAGSDWPPPCPHCGDQLLTSEDRGLHCDGCDDLTAEDEEAIMLKFCGPNNVISDVEGK